MWQRTQLDTLATSYSNVFLILAALTFFLRSGPAPSTAASHAAVEVG